MTPTSANTTVFAGAFKDWLAQARATLLGDAGSDVPCGDCVGCCVSSYYIPLRIQDHAARERVPEEFVVHAAGQPQGHAMMGFRDDGTCPMLNAGQCSIYQHRPQTCRDYDCRIFAAAGIDAGTGKDVINRRVREWRFEYPTDADRTAHDAVLAASAFIREKKASFPGGRAPTASTGIAVLAIKAYNVFLAQDVHLRNDAEIAGAIIKASGEFDAGMQPL